MASTTTDVIDGVTTSTALKAPVKVATTANITLSGTQTIDGVAVVADDRVLVKDQTTTTENGVYIVSATAWSRSSDFDGNRDIRTGTIVFVTSGTVNAASAWRVTSSDPITIGTDAITFVQNTIMGGGDVVGTTDVQTLTNKTVIRAIAQHDEDYTLVLTDGNKTLYRSSSDSTDRQYSVPLNSSVAFPVGQEIPGENHGSGTLTIVALSTATLYNLENAAVYDADVVIPQGASYVLRKYATDAWSVRIIQSEPYPKGYISGFLPSTDTDTDHDINYTTGECRSSGDAFNCAPSWSERTKQIDATFAAGDDAGGMATGSVANTTLYSANLIRNDTDLTNFDICFDTSATGANTPSGWTFMRSIDVFMTDGSANIVRRVSSETASGALEHLLYDFTNEVDTTNPGTSAVTSTLATVPQRSVLDVKAKLSVQLQDAAGDSSKQLIVTETRQNDTAPSSTVYTVKTLASGADITASSVIELRPNASRQIRYRVSASDTDVQVEIVSHGYTDNRMA